VRTGGAHKLTASKMTVAPSTTQSAVFGRRKAMISEELKDLQRDVFAVESPIV